MAVDLVADGERQYYVYCYEGSLNILENAVFQIRYPRETSHCPKALRAFICTDVSLDIRKIFDMYVERWLIEVFLC